ncbi:MAG: hypothetical protein ACKOAD_07070 [Gammaproteobacteria bacterium]
MPTIHKKIKALQKKLLDAPISTRHIQRLGLDRHVMQKFNFLKTVVHLYNKSAHTLLDTFKQNAPAIAKIVVGSIPFGGAVQAVNIATNNGVDRVVEHLITQFAVLGGMVSDKVASVAEQGIDRLCSGVKHVLNHHLPKLAKTAEKAFETLSEKLPKMHAKAQELLGKVLNKLPDLGEKLKSLVKPFGNGRLSGFVSKICGFFDKIANLFKSRAKLQLTKD